MIKRIWIVALIVIIAMILLSCAQTDDGPQLVVPNPTITATNTRVAWKPASLISGGSPYHPASLGVCDGTSVKSTGQNWAYLAYTWADVEPVRGQYDFSGFDTALAGIGTGQTLMLKVIVNNPALSSGVVPTWAYDYPDTGNDNIYLLPATSKGTICGYNATSAADRVVCSPDNLANYSSLTAAQKTNFDQFCRNSQRAAGWDAKFLEYYGDLMQAMANHFDNDMRVSGFIIHSGGDYGESGLMYGYAQDDYCGVGGTRDALDPGNTIVRTMAEIFGVSTSTITSSCRPDDAVGNFGSIFYEDANYTWEPCWGRYYSLAIKKIIDVAKLHWRATPLVFSMGNGIMPTDIWPWHPLPAGDGDMAVSYDVPAYALKCYGDYSVYVKQDGWAPGTAYGWLMRHFTMGYTFTGLSQDIGKTVGSMEHANKEYWAFTWQYEQAFNEAYDSMKLGFPCLGSGWFATMPDSFYANYNTLFRANFDTYSRAGVLAYQQPTNPQSCLAGLAYPTPTMTITPGGPTLTFTPTPIPPTATSTPGGPAPTATHTSTAVAGGGSITLYPVQDSWVNAALDDYNFGTGTTMSIRQSGISRPIMQFDLSAIPAGATVNSAELRFSFSTWDYGETVKTLSVYTVTNSWTETGVTWNSRNGTDAWASAGGDYGASAGSMSVSGAGQKSFVSAALNTAVQRWFAGTLANNGLMLMTAEADFQSLIWSRESTQKPALIVYYTSPTATATTAPATSTHTPTPVAVSTVWLGRELVTNPSFEVAGAGGADVFASWTEAADGGGAIAIETASVHWGTNAVKITSGGAPAAVVHQAFSGVVAGQTYRLTFWTHGDGTNDTRYLVYDLTNSADILAMASTGVTGTTWTPITASFTVPAGCTQFRVLLYSKATAGAISYFDDVSLIRTDTHAYTATVGQIITYTMYITSSTTVTDVLLYNRFVEGVATPIGATPVATWGASLNRYYWPSLTLTTTMQGFTTIWQLPPGQAPGSQTYRNLSKANKGAEAISIAESTHVAIAIAPTYTPTPTPTFTVTPTYTPTPTATSTSIPNFYISEVMIKPTAAIYCDWNGDGECDSDDQWIEVYQPNPTPQAFDKYKVRFTATDGRVYTYTIPIGTTVNGYVVLWPYIHWGQHISPTSEIAISTWANVQQHSVTMPGATPDYAYQFRPEGYANVTPVWYLWPSFGSANMVSTPTPTYTPNP